MMNENVARDAAPKAAAMATRANAPGDKFAPENKWFVPIANAPPSAALDMNMGASNPPEVPDPNEITRAIAFAIITMIKSLSARFDVAERVVSHAADPRHKVTNDSEHKRGDGWPTELVNGQLLELISRPIQSAADS